MSDHLHQMFAHWTSLPVQKRAEIWTLELARSVGRKFDEAQRLKKEKELSQQETAHLKLQVDELSRLQHPREFRLVPPSTIPMDSRFMAEAGAIAIKAKQIGWSILDRNEQLDKSIERAIGRWKGVVKEARGAGPNSAGMATQRSLSGELSTPLQPLSQSRTPILPQHAQHHSPMKANKPSNSNSNGMNNTAMTNGADDPGSDQDADADADMEEDESFVEMDVRQRAPEAQIPQGAGFRLSNGVNEQRNTVMDGLENTSCVSGYVRIGA